MNRISLVNNHLAQGREVCIVAYGRSPLGPYRGDLSGYSATELSGLTLKLTLAKYGIDPNAVQELCLGNVYSAGLGQSPAKQTAVKAGLPDTVVCSSVNKVCSSGMLAIVSAYMTISQGHQDVVAAGGVEIMSNVPYYMPRNSKTKGDSELIDGMIKDGLWDSRYNVHMGECAEKCAEKYKITRKQMDDFSINSNLKAEDAWKNGKFKDEVIPIPNPKKPGEMISKDHIKGSNQKFEKLKTAFRKDNGTVTAGNASPLSDGAAMIVLSSRAKAQEMGWTVVGTILSFAHHEQNNIEFTTSPNLAIRKAIRKAEVNIENVDFFELNEAFAVVGISNVQLLGIPIEKVNVYGGALAIGHPIGCSGARIVVTLLSALRQEKSSLGVAAICNGGGGGSAIVIRI